MLVYTMIFPNTTFIKEICRNPSLGLATIVCSLGSRARCGGSCQTKEYLNL